MPGASHRRHANDRRRPSPYPLPSPNSIRSRCPTPKSIPEPLPVPVPLLFPATSRPRAASCSLFHSPFRAFRCLYLYRIRCGCRCPSVPDSGTRCRGRPGSRPVPVVPVPYLVCRHPSPGAAAAGAQGFTLTPLFLVVGLSVVEDPRCAPVVVPVVEPDVPDVPDVELDSVTAGAATGRSAA